MKRIVMAVAMVLCVNAAHANEPMTLAEFRARTEQAQIYMVVGATALTDKLGIVCPPNGVAIGEWRAALRFRDFPVTQSWVEVLLQLMDERGCISRVAPGDT